MLDPQSIFFPPYLASAFVIALAALMHGEGLSARAAARRVFGREVWLSKSTRVDALFSLAFELLVRAPLAALEAAVFGGVFAGAGAALAHTGDGFTAQLPAGAAALLATATTMLAIDLASYGVHRALHRFPLLWAAHKLHHSAERLTPLTTYRQHPAELLLLHTARPAAAGLGLALLHRVLPQGTPVITVFGMGAGFFAYMFTVNLHHAPVPVHYPRWVRRFLLSPHGHHLHHSADPRHHGRNFGVVFSVWDRLFASYLDERVAPGSLRFGLGDEDHPITSRRRRPRLASWAHRWPLSPK